MSAFMVAKLHIDLLVQVAVEGPPGAHPSSWHPFHYYAVPSCELRGYDLDLRQQANRVVDLAGADTLGQMLAAENTRSVRERYDDADARSLIPDWADSGYCYTPPHGRRPNVIELLKAINCYEYQTCETDDWADTEAAQFCNTLRDLLIRYLSGYEDAPWEWTPDVIEERR